MKLVKVRLQGVPAAVEAAASQLRAALRVHGESKDYANRGKSPHVRRYIEVQVDIDPADDPEAPDGPVIDNPGPPAIEPFPGLPCPQCGAVVWRHYDEHSSFYIDAAGYEQEVVNGYLVCDQGHEITTREADNGRP